MEVLVKQLFFYTEALVTAEILKQLRGLYIERFWSNSWYFVIDFDQTAGFLIERHCETAEIFTWRGFCRTPDFSYRRHWSNNWDFDTERRLSNSWPESCYREG